MTATRGRRGKAPKYVRRRNAKADAFRSRTWGVRMRLRSVRLSAEAAERRARREAERGSWVFVRSPDVTIEGLRNGLLGSFSG